MSFNLIDHAKWRRKEYFDHYMHEVPCTYSMTLNLDLTDLINQIKKEAIKLYPTMLYLISLTVNGQDEFRTAINANGQIGVFDLLHPSYTIFQKESETFANIWTEYTSSFNEFYERYLLDIKNYGAVKKFEAKPDVPANVFNVSSIPWVTFTGFNLNLPKATDYLLPIFTLGKYFAQNDRIWLPIAIQVHHAVCDGFHIAKFIEELQESMNTIKLLHD